MSETIWSSGHNPPIQNNLLLASTTTNNTSQYKSVIDQVDPDVIRLFANSNSFDPLSSSQDQEQQDILLIKFVQIEDYHLMMVVTLLKVIFWV